MPKIWELLYNRLDGWMDQLSAKIWRKDSEFSFCWSHNTLFIKPKNTPWMLYSFKETKLSKFDAIYVSTWTYHKKSFELKIPISVCS